jgi:ABC-type amino acid transport substrate-binding protein
LDYVITAYTTALKVANKNKVLVCCRKNFTDEYAAIAFSIKSNGTMDEVNKVVGEFKQDGTLDSIISGGYDPDGSAYS